MTPSSSKVNTIMARSIVLLTAPTFARYTHTNTQPRKCKQVHHSTACLPMRSVAPRRQQVFEHTSRQSKRDGKDAIRIGRSELKHNSICVVFDHGTARGRVHNERAFRPAANLQKSCFAKVRVVAAAAVGTNKSFVGRSTLYAAAQAPTHART